VSIQGRVLIVPKSWVRSDEICAVEFDCIYQGTVVIHFAERPLAVQVYKTTNERNVALSYSHPKHGLIGFYFFEGGTPTFVELRNSYYFAVEKPMFSSN
ncbi:MAG: hypothetical protein VXW22_14355, partial [Pseudomonadota bacterium]|nr:hypothetical protein [Pseudomonadota bacterium]